MTEPTQQPVRPPTRRWIVAALTFALAVGGGVVIGRGTSSPAPSTSPAPGCPSRTNSQAMGNMSSPEASLGQFIGRQAGTAMAGNGPITLSAAQLKTLGNQVPAGAHIDGCANQVVFASTSVSFVIEAAPSNNPDMTFRLAGLVNPTVLVPRDAQVSIEFVNGDSDEAHAFVITKLAPPYSFVPSASPAFAGSEAGPIGDPTSAGHGARDLSFTADKPGTYHYLCPMPGHAQMGMNGMFIVQ